MSDSEGYIHQRATSLAEDILAMCAERRPLEWIEVRLGEALLEIAREERDRCATIAEDRVRLWTSTVERTIRERWPIDARTEARERLKEAIVIADAIRARSGDSGT
jgi:hypothetical protein